MSLIAVDVVVVGDVTSVGTLDDWTFVHGAEKTKQQPRSTSKGCFFAT